MARYRDDKNLAMKVPPDQYEATVAFYRDTLRLEVVTDDAAAAAVECAEAGVPRRDEIEALGIEFDGYWVTSPCSIIHLVDSELQTSE